MCRTPREAGCVMRWTALPRYGKRPYGSFFVPSRRRCFPRSYGFPAGNVPVSDNIPAGFAVTFLAHFSPARTCFVTFAPRSRGSCLQCVRMRRLRLRPSQDSGQTDALPGCCGIIPHGCRIIPQILYIFDLVFGRYFAVNKCFKGLPAILAQGLNPVLLPPMILVLYEI